MGAFWCLIILQLLAICGGQHTTPIVNIAGLGLIEGSIGSTAWTNRVIYQFQAIPYAQPPVGNLRFKAPVRVSGWSGTRNASQPGISCPQIADEYESNQENEDCLTLSVYSNNLDTKRPVMVFVHGGWFFIGGAEWYGPQYLLERDVVLVVIQYRLGPLGFLSMLSETIPGNAGILDVIAALEWVQQYIGHFGGNSNQVTIFGESAGSAAVSALLHSPLVQNREPALFHRAILHSGSVFSPWATCDTPIESAMDIARRAGCATANTEQCLMTVATKTLLEAFMAHRNETIINSGYPYVGGTTIVVGGPSGLFPQHPKKYLARANKNIAVMGGTNAQEGLFLLQEINSLEPHWLKSLNSSYEILEFLRVLNEKFGQNKLDGALEAYQTLGSFLTYELDNAPTISVLASLIDICGNHGIKGPVLTDIVAYSRVNPEYTYLYSFDYASSNIVAINSTIFPLPEIVNHAEELYYLFPISDLNDKDTKLAKNMVQLWTSFASSSIPTANDIVYWPPANNAYGPYLKIQANSEQRKYYLNEFSSTLDKFGYQHSGAGHFASAGYLGIGIIMLSYINKLKYLIFMQ